VSFQTKRVYEPPDPEDGLRILIDRLWPRGLSKDRANLTCWAKDLAPTVGLRACFHHDPNKWEAFKSRYFQELESKTEIIQKLLQKVQHGLTITLLYSAKDTRHNNAQALLEFLLEKLKQHP
jgi:uncharacterized protein YeaO (DUF488 family)